MGAAFKDIEGEAIMGAHRKIALLSGAALLMLGQPVLAACDALVGCCTSLTDSSARTACFDQIDQQDLQASCTSTLERYRDDGLCQPGSDADAGASSADAGDTLSSLHALCCYQVCGYTHCN